MSHHPGLGKQQGPGSQRGPEAFPGSPLGRLLLLALLPVFPACTPCLCSPACAPCLGFLSAPSCSPWLCCCFLQFSDLLCPAVPTAHPAAAGHCPVCMVVVPDPQHPAEPDASCCLVIQARSLASGGAHSQSVPGDPPGIPGLTPLLPVTPSPAPRSQPAPKYPCPLCSWGCCCSFACWLKISLTLGVFKNSDLALWIVPVSASPTSELTEQKIMQKFPF